MPKVMANPFKPGAGHSPPHLAGRDREKREFKALLRQDPITQNLVLTGLRGVGKTVLMDDIYKAMASTEGWVWVGSDFSEAAFVDEKSLCQRLLTDLSLFTSNLRLATRPARSIGFQRKSVDPGVPMTYDLLIRSFEAQPGLFADKLKATLEFAWQAVAQTDRKGILFAYDEAQVVQDRRDKDQYPLALLLETFQSLQRKGMRYMLLLTGLPALFPKLVQSRTYAERMFKVQELGHLDKQASRDAIQKPLEKSAIQFSPESVEAIVSVSNCYPYFIQFICRESFDHLKLAPHASTAPLAMPMETLIRKLDSDFFAGRWARVPDRQRELLLCISHLDSAGSEFTVREIVEISRTVAGAHRIRPFKAADASQMLPKLIESGLVYRNRHGKYSLAVPLFDGFIKRQF